MKRYAMALLLMAIIFMLLPFSLAEAEKNENAREAVFILPASLIEIEEEAFSGTGPQTVVFPEGFQRIGDRAFEGAHRLTDVYIPSTARYIADFAFPRTAHFTVHGVHGSYAEEWAEKHRIPFAADDTGHAAVRSGKDTYSRGVLISRRAAAICPEKMITVHERGEGEGKSKRPQDRAELNPIDYSFP